VDSETGEVLDSDKLSALQLEKDEKIENLALWVKNLEAEATALKAEKMAFAERQAKTEKLIASLKETLVRELNGSKFNTTKVQVSFRKSEKVEVEDVFKLPDDLVVYKMPEPNKTEIKKLLKAGQEITGCKLINNNNIQIK
jgi:hypothetical protein